MDPPTIRGTIRYVENREVVISRLDPVDRLHDFRRKRLIHRMTGTGNGIDSNDSVAHLHDDR